MRSTAPKDAVKRVLDEKKWGKEKLCEELEELRAARKRYLRSEIPRTPSSRNAPLPKTAVGADDTRGSGRGFRLKSNVRFGTECVCNHSFGRTLIVGEATDGREKEADG